MPLVASATICSICVPVTAVSGVTAGSVGKSLVIVMRGIVAGDCRHIAVGVPQHQARQIVQRMMAHRAVEIDRPQRRACARRHVPDDEGRMGQVELQIQRIVLTRADDQRRDEIDIERHGEIGRLPWVC